MTVDTNMTIRDLSSLLALVVGMLLVLTATGVQLRRRKRGFGVNVVDDWIRKTTRTGSVAAIVSEDTSLRDFIRRDAVSRLLDSHVSGQSDNHKLLFSLAVCQQWLRSA